MAMANILIIDDDKMLCEMLCREIGYMGHHAVYTFTLDQGVNEVLSEKFDVVFLDVNLPDGNGLDALPRIRESEFSPEVIIITGEGDPDGAELAIKSGVWDYIEKTSSIKQIMLPLQRAIQYREEKFSGTHPVALKREGIIGKSPKITACLDIVAQAASSNASVLITGETGTGKELFARAIHDNSARADRVFAVVDCTVLPKTLFESVLFGHEKGAFTGADKAREGLIGQADGGTLFLDEIGELPLSIQKAFLRVLQEHRFRLVGGKEERKSDFRLLAATNRNLDSMSETAEFRQDLLFRLRSLSVELPPLRKCREDIIELAMYHVARICGRLGVETKGFSPEFFDALASYDWPGNIRELFNTLEGAVSLAGKDPTLYSKHLPTHIRVRMARASVGEHNDIERSLYPSGDLPKLKDFRESLERQYLKDLISLTRRDIKKACRISGLSRSHLYELLKKYTIMTRE
jgi:two-component system, NtrC family, response regulator